MVVVQIFQKFQLLVDDLVGIANVHNHTTFHQNQSNIFRDMMFNAI